MILDKGETQNCLICLDIEDERSPPGGPLPGGFPAGSWNTDMDSPPKWLMYRSISERHILLDVAIGSANHPRRGQCDFWDSLYRWSWCVGICKAYCRKLHNYPLFFITAAVYLLHEN